MQVLAPPRYVAPSPHQLCVCLASRGALPFETDLGLSSQRVVPACLTRNILQVRRAPGQIQKDGRSI